MLLVAGKFISGQNSELGRTARYFRPWINSLSGKPRFGARRAAAASGETKKGSTANGLPFSDCRVKQVMLPCVNHDAGHLCARRHDGHRHDAHDARRHGRLKLQMQKRLRSG